MRTNEYESTIIINAALEDAQIEAVVIKFKELIENNGGTIKELDRWGRKRLAYPIKKSKLGYYVVYWFTGTADFITKLERAYKLDENIIRFLTVKLSREAVEYLSQQKVRKEQEAVVKPAVEEVITEPETKTTEQNADGENNSN